MGSTFSGFDRRRNTMVRRWSAQQTWCSSHSPSSRALDAPVSQRAQNNRSWPWTSMLEREVSTLDTQAQNRDQTHSKLLPPKELVFLKK